MGLKRKGIKTNDPGEDGIFSWQRAGRENKRQKTGIVNELAARLLLLMRLNSFDAVVRSAECDLFQSAERGHLRARLDRRFEQKSTRLKYPRMTNAISDGCCVH